MASLTTSIRSIAEGLRDQLTETVSSLEELYRPSQRSALRDNFKQYGSAFGVYNYSDFREMARRFYEDALTSKDSLYTIIQLSKHTIGIDYNGDMRGIYNARDGDPIAFFKPNFAALGYSSKQQEIEDWKKGKAVWVD